MKHLRTVGFLLAAVCVGLAIGPPRAAAAGALDLNRASLEEIKKLPIPEEDAETIWSYREYHAYFSSVYDLRKLPGFTQEELDRLKPLVKVVPVLVEDEELQRVNEIYYRIRQWEAEEGGGEALVDYWIDLAKDPVNVNTASYQDIANLQSISPPDAAAIYNYTRSNRLDTQSALRNVPGLTYWGYYNARNFVRYKDPAEEAGLRGSYQFRITNSPTVFDVSDCLKEDRNPGTGMYDSWWDRLKLDDAGPIYQHKVRMRWGRDIRAGALVYSGLGAGDEYDATKFHVTVRDKTWGPIHFDNTIIGNYAVAFGQGLVMQNTDFLRSRNSGYGWEKRYIGILGDITQTQEFQLTGGATEFSVGNTKSILFYSDDWKDAVLNPDGTANQYIVMSPRIENDDLAAGGLRPMRDVLHERTYGGNARYMFGTGTWIGLSGYESRYNKYFKAAYDPNATIDVSWMVPDDDEDKLVTADGEYFSSYTSPGKFRRVYGTEFQWVYKNVVFAGEYAGLDKDGDLFDFSKDANALVLNGYATYANLDLLAIYRDYDLDFDNPYDRGFAEYKRYKSTVLEDQFYLSDPLYGLLYENSFAPQAERGLYLSSRYRYTNRLTPAVEYDVWERQSDGADYSRLVLKMRFQPIYNIVMNLRQKWQGRLTSDWITPQEYDQVETRYDLEYRLSKFDEVGFLVSRAWIRWPPRPRLSDNVDDDGGHPSLGNAASPSYALSGTYTHNFSDWLKLTGAFTYYDGFLWVFEDGEFTVADGKALRYFVSISDRVSDHLSLRLRWSNDHAYPLTYVDARQYNTNPSGSPDVDAWYARTDQGAFKLQMDYSW
jgi:DNA uptake protein ComE-like DNA-binding protein